MIQTVIEMICFTLFTVISEEKKTVAMEMSVQAVVEYCWQSVVGHHLVSRILTLKMQHLTLTIEIENT